MTIRARGTSLQLLGLKQASHGTPASGTYQRLAAYTCEFETTADYAADQVLSIGNGREPADPYQDVFKFAGSVRVPLNTGDVAFWMSMLLGTETDTGVSPIVSTWTSGGALSDYTLERGYTDIGAYALFSDVKADTLDLQLTPSGGADMTIGLMGCVRTDGTATVSASPTTPAFSRLLRHQGQVKVDGAVLANVVSAQMKTTNALEEIRTVQNTAPGRPIDLDAGLFDATGQLVVRHTSDSLIDTTAAHTLSLEFDYGTSSLVFALGRVFFGKPAAGVKGPNGTEATYNWRAAHDSVAGAALKVTWTHT